MSEAKSNTSTIVLPKVKDGLENKGVLHFTLENANVSVANAIRRTILSNIDTVILDTDKNINIQKNTTRLHNEILKQRLGCLPVHIKDFSDIQNLTIELHKVNDTDSLVYITTHDFKIKNTLTNKYLTPEQTQLIFPINNITKQYILVSRLRPKISNDIPGEILTFNTKLTLGNAKQNGMYNVVSTCAYGNTPDKVEQHNQWQDIAQELEKNGLSEKQIEYKKQNWETLQGKRFYLSNSFDFKLESVGVFTNYEIIHKALDILIQKFDTISELSDKESININRKSTAMIHSLDITLQNEDYTIGKVIEYILHEQYYKNDKILSYVGFIKKHPHDDFSIIRIAFNETEDMDIYSDSNVYKMLKFSCKIAKNLFTNIKEYF